MSEYRINYGNGQVDGTYRTLSEVQREFDRLKSDQYFEYFRIERYEGDGEWSTVKGSSNPARSRHRAGASMRAQPRNRAGSRCYRVVGVWEDARGTVLKKWVMAYGPLTHAEGMTVISKTVPRKNTRYMVEETDCLPEYPESLHRALRENRAGSWQSYDPAYRDMTSERATRSALNQHRSTLEHYKSLALERSPAYRESAAAYREALAAYRAKFGQPTGTRPNRAGENPNSQDGFMGWFFRYANLRGRYLHFNGHNPFSGSYGTLQATFVNLPTPEVERSPRLSVEALNRRQVFSIRGFDARDPAAPAPGKLKIETLSAGPYPRLRGKTGTPEQIARYLGEHLSAIVANNAAGRRTSQGWS